MKKVIKCFVIFILLLCCNRAYADSTVYCDNPATIEFNSITSKVYLSCSGDFSSLNLITFDPFTLIEEYDFYIGGQATSVIPVDGGANLLLLLANVDGDTSSNDGVLRKVDASTGSIISGYEVGFDDVPLTMVADSNQTYLYVTWGLSKHTATINKIRISDFQVMPQLADYGELPLEIALSQDNSKLYLTNRRQNTIHSPLPNNTEYYYNIGVINTVDMTLVGEINIGDFMPYDLQMGYDNRLFLSFPIPSESENDNISLLVIDTIADQVIKSVDLAEEGIADIAIDPISQRLYGTSCPKDYYHPVKEQYIHRPTGVIIYFDLNDLSYTPSYFTLGNEGLLAVEVASTIGGSRIFGFADDISSSSIYYMDL